MAGLRYLSIKEGSFAAQKARLQAAPGLLQ